jgi:hypothetical protein
MEESEETTNLWVHPSQKQKLQYYGRKRGVVKINWIKISDGSQAISFLRLTHQLIIKYIVISQKRQH